MKKKGNKIKYVIQRATKKNHLIMNNDKRFYIKVNVLSIKHCLIVFIQGFPVGNIFISLDKWL